METKLTEIKGMMGRVKTILETIPQSRDNDRLIYSHLLLSWMHLKGIRPIKITGMRMISMMAQYRDMPNLGSVVRTRALIQSRHPDLRGITYDKRQKLGKETKAEFAELKLQFNAYDPQLFHQKPSDCICGKRPIVLTVEPDVWVECSCGEKSTRHLTADEAAIAWNEHMDDLKELYDNDRIKKS